MKRMSLLASVVVYYIFVTCFSTPRIVFCSSAMYLRECEGTTRSSWSAVVSSIAGYCTSELAGALKIKNFEKRP